MFSSDVLEVATGIVFVYLLLSLVVTSCREFIENMLKQRGKTLEQGLIELFGASDPQSVAAGYLKAFYEHPLIYSLYRAPYTPIDADKGKRPLFGADSGKNLPSYIPSSSFAHAVVDMLGGGNLAALPMTVERLASAVDAMPPGQLKDAVRLAVHAGEGDLQKTRAFLETWFDSTMDRVSGWYTRHTQVLVLCLSLAGCMLFNVNSVIITESLFQNSSLRASVVAQADKTAAAGSSAAKQNLDAGLDRVLAVGMPIGWTGDGLKGVQVRLYGAPLSQPTAAAPHGRVMTWDLCSKPGDCQVKGPSLFGLAELVAGWFMTAFAITLGAPFWFDVLNRIVSIRSSVKPPAKDDAVSGMDGAAAPVSSASPPQSPPPPPVDPAEQAEVSALDPAQRPREG